MELFNGYFWIEMSDEKIECRLTMWVVDENRFSNAIAKKPGVIWSMAAQFYLCYLNACRFAKKQATLTEEDFELWVDEMYCFKKEYLNEIELAITKETQRLFPVQQNVESDSGSEEKKILPGLTPELSPSENLG